MRPSVSCMQGQVAVRQDEQDKNRTKEARGMVLGALHMDTEGTRNMGIGTREQGHRA